MKTEYIKISSEELTYSQKNILESQIDVISLMRTISNYKKLRTEEIMAKLQFKEVIEQLKENMNYLDKLLPNSEFLEDFTNNNITVEKKQEITKSIAMETELDSIKARLAGLKTKLSK